jgi:hypothetical protein
MNEMDAFASTVAFAKPLPGLVLAQTDLLDGDQLAKSLPRNIYSSAHFHSPSEIVL